MMIRKFIFVWILVLMMTPIKGTAVEMEGVEIPEILTRDDISLVLNGAGVQSRFFFDIYVSALYLKDRSQDAEKIMRDEDTMAISIFIVSGFFDIDSLKDALADGFEYATGGNTQPIQPQIDRLMELLHEEIDDGDSFDFIYLPKSGLNIFRNGQFIDAIKGINFKRAFFGIWLGDSPADDDLKEEMLGL